MVVRVAIHLGERQRSRDRLSQIGEGRLGSRGAPLRIERDAHQPRAPVRPRPLHGVPDVRRPGGERDVAAEARPQLLFQTTALGFRERKDWRPAPDLPVQLAHVRGATPGYGPREPPPQRPSQQRNADQERIAKEVLEVGLNRLQRIRAAQIEEQDSRMGWLGRKADGNHAAGLPAEASLRDSQRIHPLPVFSRPRGPGGIGSARKQEENHEDAAASRRPHSGEPGPSDFHSCAHTSGQRRSLPGAARSCAGDRG